MSEPKKTFQELLENHNVAPESLGDMTVLRPIYEEFMLQTPVPSDVSFVETDLGGVTSLEREPGRSALETGAGEGVLRRIPPGAREPLSGSPR
jgi:hypothetical protein